MLLRAPAHHANGMKSTALLVLLLSACSQAPIAEATKTPTGRTVTEIDPRIWCIHQCRNGDYWFGSNGNGVYRYDGQVVTHYQQSDGLSGDAVRDIEEDRNGHVLIATTDGVSKFDGKKFTTLEIVDVTTADEAWAPRNNDAWKHDVWLGCQPGDHGPCRYDGDKLYRLQLTKSPAEDAFRARHPNTSYDPAGVYSIYRDRTGNLWFGTGSVGLCRYDGKTLSWMYEARLTETPEGGAFGIRSIYQDRAGDFWICNTRQRFQMQAEPAIENGYSVLQYQQRAGLPDASADRDENFIYFPSMTEDDAGALWMVCGSDGAWKFDGEQVTRYAIGDGAYAMTICRDRNGKLWIGTLEHGIHVFDGEKFEPFRA